MMSDPYLQVVHHMVYLRYKEYHHLPEDDQALPAQVQDRLIRSEWLLLPPLA